ncbi:hypothetical protein LQ567_22070 [Niabella pedocola]|uniref:DUF4595 domain-containing protein n=1 Tax=Niabella pedocola TaxID=1752077 RepID=A0ABS8PWM7_9BACT|nr:hypothetical protein [Niabella pedocola]MCD2425487.1 hypothetical protein [Niabella pedocola]
MKYLRINHLFLTSIFILTVCSGIAQTPPFYKVTPFEEEGYFSKTVFPFNPAFIKSKKVKTLVLYDQDKTGRDYHYSFDTNGRTTGFITLQREGEKTDTVFYTVYGYTATGNTDYTAQIDYHNGLVRTSKYAYNEEGTLSVIRNFTLDADMPGRPQKGSIMNYQTVPGSYRSLINGHAPGDAFYEKQIEENNFSSRHYRYYTENGANAVEQTEIFDFKKQYQDRDTCSSRKTFYYKNGVPVLLFLHRDCDAKLTPSEYYNYQNGLLTGIRENPNRPDPRNEQYSYDKHQNLMRMENEWGGQVVSTLTMTYDNRVFLKSIQRKSASAKVADYFEDRVLEVTYTFYR